MEAVEEMLNTNVMEGIPDISHQTEFLPAMKSLLSLKIYLISMNHKI